jgi:ArsR family transcriptional regulator
MNDAVALNVFAALSHAARLNAFRRLAEVAPSGLPATVLARELNYNLTTLSTHLNILARAGLISGSRDGRFIIYKAEFAIPTKFINHFLIDCCQGRATTSPQQEDAVPESL